MSSRRKDSETETPLSPSEMQALRRLAEPTAQQTLPEPEELWASRYRIMEPIGHGGMGDVFLARDVLLDRLVALKVLRSSSDESFVDERRLLREARAAARAEHERIARIYDAGTWKDRAFIAMEYVRGETLRAWMKKYRPSSSEVVAIVQQLLEGLQALHDRGLVHRDLKPENVMVSIEGDLRILDLGVARRVPLADTSEPLGEAPGTLTLGFGVGTPGYMAPEQWRRGDVDARADLFALGVIAYELIVGRAPFRGTTNLEIREQTLHAEVSFSDPAWKDIPVALRNAVRTALARDPQQRFGAVPAMAEALASLFRPTLPPISGARTPRIRPPGEDKGRRESLAASVAVISQRALPRRRTAWFALSGAALVAASLLAFRWWPKQPAAPPILPGMIRLSGGAFTLGTDAEKLPTICSAYPHGCPSEINNETPPRPVTISHFDIDHREVTNEEFARFLTTIGPSIRVLPDPEEGYPRYVRYFLRSTDDLLLYDLWAPSRGIEFPGDSFRPRPGFENLPVTLVTWLAARLFCKSFGKRLPTEAEWEFAARGNEGRLFPWGNQQPDCERMHVPSDGSLAVRNPERCDNERTFPFPVMSAAGDVTPEGAWDMGGNVLEWVDDNVVVNTDEATYVNRLTAESSAVYRGGAYNSSFMARTTSRSFRLAFNVGLNLGFRCAKTVDSR
ncbi:MAG TPA: bifunctional serine/threonine-protein kinase/formylglycine-generating enzyme family protein [Polyangiaceae bacterium]|nr:bifunctional serine/threonine-protein kinase/formylglycine-generating enzyme family protein [Polyangiaceae bacterium]